MGSFTETVRKIGCAVVTWAPLDDSVIETVGLNITAGCEVTLPKTRIGPHAQIPFPPGLQRNEEETMRRRRRRMSQCDQLEQTMSDCPGNATQHNALP